MTLFEYYLKYMSEICEGTRKAPDGINITENDEMKKAMELQQQISAMGIPDFVRLCAQEDGVEIPQEEYDNFDPNDMMRSFQQMMAAQEAAPVQEPEPEKEPEPDPDAGKHAFEVFLDCIALDDGLVQYLIKVLKDKDWKEFYKLSQITTKMDLDPEEFLFWLGNRELYSDEEEQACATIMDQCLLRLKDEGKLEILAALLSGDQQTFEIFRCEAPELQHLPAATFEWFAKNYLDRDYPIRLLMKLNGVEFPTVKE